MLLPLEGLIPLPAPGKVRGRISEGSGTLPLVFSHMAPRVIHGLVFSGNTFPAIGHSTFSLIHLFAEERVPGDRSSSTYHVELEAAFEKRKWKSWRRLSICLGFAALGGKTKEILIAKVRGAV